jgi:lipid-A-disaccharide synthase-like uncharacterized protein
MKTHIICNPQFLGYFMRNIYVDFLFITNLISNYNNSAIIFRFKHISCLVGGFKIVHYFLMAQQLIVFLCHILKFCKCKRWR